MTSHEIAVEIHALINSHPRSPTVEEIEAIVAKVYATGGPLPGGRTYLVGEQGMGLSVPSNETIARIAANAARAAAQAVQAVQKDRKP